jgi:hypothetical protein
MQLKMRCVLVSLTFCAVYLLSFDGIAYAHSPGARPVPVFSIPLYARIVFGLLVGAAVDYYLVGFLVAFYEGLASKEASV